MSSEKFEDVGAIVDAIVDKKGRHLTVGTPLGLGKPNDILNELVRRATDGELEHLEIFTALSLGKPRASNELERRLMGPIIDRVFGEYHDLDYVGLRAAGELPDNVEIHEFYYPPGSLLESGYAQRNYKSVNYTHAMREIVASEPDVIAQLVAPGRGGGYDLSCNTDISVDLFPLLREREDRPLFVGQVNSNLPVMGGEAELPREDFDLVLDHPDYVYGLYAMPSMPPTDGEYMIGLRTAALLKDGGTIQVGIGNLGETVSWATILRHRDPETFRELLDACGVREETRAVIEQEGGTGAFEEGLYASTEMLVEGILQMYEHGVLTREVYDDLATQEAANAGTQVDADGVLAHGAFFLGSHRFYDILRDLSEDELSRIRMTAVQFTNKLFGGEALKRAQRKNGRFINEGMKVTGVGAVCSDAIADGRVVSGVGGQYEFVAQAHELEGARSILMIQAVRGKRDNAESNVVWNYGNVTIPRHLRDIVVTEYGVADLRGASDEEVARALVELMDARFQDEFVTDAKAAGKLPPDYQVPARARENTPERLREALKPFRESGDIPRTPFGSALTDLELDLVDALQNVKGIVDDVVEGRLPDLDLEGLYEAAVPPDEAKPYLERMGLDDPDGAKTFALQRLVVYGLSACRHV